MPRLKVYNGEFFERGVWWYLIFGAVICLIIGLSLFYKVEDRVQAIIGVIILLMIVGAYLFFLAKTQTETTMEIQKEWILIWDRLVVFEMLNGFVIEIDKKTGAYQNIVLISKHTAQTYTLKDTATNAERFFQELSKLLPLLDDYEQTFFTRLVKKLKL